MVYIDGEPIGFVAKRNDFIEVVDRVEDSASRILGYPYSLDADISYKIEMFNRNEMLDLRTAERSCFHKSPILNRLMSLLLTERL